MDLSAFELFREVVQASIPYALTWVVGTWVVNTVLNWVTGRSYSL